MIQKIVLRNFQKHKKCVLSIARITTLQGRSDSGKSAVLRALRWVCRNQPSGDAFIRHRQKWTSVKLYVDGRAVKRTKGKENAYYLDSKKFVAFKSDVPDEIARLLNVEDVNFQSQFDPVYWLSDSGGQVSRNLNRIINLQVIDNSLSHVAAELRKATHAVEINRSRLKEAKGDRDRLAWVPEFVRELTDLERLEERIAVKRSRIASLESILKDVSAVREASRNAAPAISEGLALVKLGEGIERKKARIGALTEVVEEIGLTKERLEECRSRSARIAVRLRKQRSCPLCGASMTG